MGTISPPETPQLQRKAEALSPFAGNDADRLDPGRLMMVSFAPKAATQRRFQKTRRQRRDKTRKPQGRSELDHHHAGDAPHIALASRRAQRAQGRHIVETCAQDDRNTADAAAVSQFRRPESKDYRRQQHDEKALGSKRDARHRLTGRARY